MSSTTRFALTYVTQTPIDREAFSKAGDDVVNLLSGLLSKIGPFAKLDFWIDGEAMCFGPSELDRGSQKHFVIERDPAAYPNQEQDYLIWIEVFSPMLRSVLEIAVEMINRHAGPVLVLSREDRLMTPRQTSIQEELDWMHAE